jgi:DNA-binding transcriptional MocR family regulator
MDDKPIFKGRGPGVPGAFTGEEVVSEETIKELARRINSGRTMERKQTAVEWLIEELGEYFPHDIGGIHLMVEQAKQMEKEQIVEAWYKRGNTIVPRYYLKENINGEQYYNKTYGK